MKKYAEHLEEFAEQFEIAIRIAALILAVSFGMVVILAGAKNAAAAA